MKSKYFLGVLVMAALGCGQKEDAKKAANPNTDNETFERLQTVKREIEGEYNGFIDKKIFVFEDISDYAKKMLKKPSILNQYIETKEEAVGYLDDLQDIEMKTGFRAQGFGLMASYRASLLGWVKVDRAQIFSDLQTGLDEYLVCENGLHDCCVELDQKYLAVKIKYYKL